MKESGCFSSEEKDHIAYDYLRKEEVAAIPEGVNKNSNNQGKKDLFLMSRERTCLFFHHLC